MWTIYESDSVVKLCRRLPNQVLKKYELWKAIVRYNGVEKLREFKGFHDEPLKGKWSGFRSSRLNIQYRVIYRFNKREVTVWIEEITAHEY
jgi:mRNA-degrading endonuclease YafQ of YafQ-DinJ toxin-antitoxin module